MSAQSTPVPLCDLLTQYRHIQEDVEAAVCRVLSSGQSILGPEVSTFEQEIADYCGSKFAVGCASGTDALLLALHALDVGPGHEVILPTFTFFATAGSVCRTGATPVFVDIDPVSYNLDPEQVARKITPRTRAIMPVHLYGQAAEMAPLQQMAEKHNLALIEDAAQAIGAEYRGQRAGSIGTVGCFSFYPSKNLGTYGDAGLVTTDDPALAEKMRSLRVHGMEPKYHHKYLGWNARLDAVHAAILRVKLRHIEEWTTGRQNAAARYDRLIDSYRLGRFFQRPSVLPDRRHVYNQYVVRVPSSDRDALFGYLKQSGVGCEIYYPVPLHLQECLRHFGYRAGDFPLSEEAAQSVIALPMYPELTQTLQERVIDTCAGYLHQRSRLAA